MANPLINKQFIEPLVSATKTEGEEVLVLMNATFSGLDVQNDNGMLYITSSGIYLCYPKGTHGRFTVANHFYFHQIKSINAASNTISFTIGSSKISAHVHHISPLFSILKSFFLHSADPLPNIEVNSECLVAEVERPFPFIDRFLYIYYQNESKSHDHAIYPKAIVDMLTEFLSQDRSRIDISKLPDLNLYQNYLFEALPTAKNVPIIILPKSSGDPNWKYIAELIQSLPDLEEITIRERFSPSFIHMIECAKKIKAGQIKSKLRLITFRHTSFQESDIPTFLSFFELSSIKKVHFINTFERKLQSTFLHLAIQNQSFDKIESITFERHYGLPIIDALRAFHNSRDFTFINCQTDVDQLISNLQIANKMETLSIEGGRSAAPPQSVSFPKDLQSISITRTEWQKQSIMSLFIQLNQFIPSTGRLSLNLSFANCPSDETWQSFFLHVNQIFSKSVNRFLWNGNPVQPSLVQYLCNIPLSFLSFSGCFSQITPAFDLFLQYIKQTKSLKTLVMAGIGSQVIGPSIVKLFEALKSNQSIDSMNVSDQSFGIIGYRSLLELLMSNKRLSMVLFDRVRFEDPEFFGEFIQTLSTRGATIKFNWPNDEIEEFAKKKAKIHQRKLYSLYNQIISETNEVVDWHSPLPEIDFAQPNMVEIAAVYSLTNLYQRFLQL